MERRSQAQFQEGNPIMIDDTSIKEYNMNRQFALKFDQTS